MAPRRLGAAMLLTIVLLTAFGACSHDRRTRQLALRRWRAVNSGPGSSNRWEPRQGRPPNLRRAVRFSPWWRAQSPSDCLTELYAALCVAAPTFKVKATRSYLVNSCEPSLFTA